MHEIIQSKSILSKLKHKDTWFGTSYSLNLYRGCSHACIYCDSRSACYQVADFDTIQIKGNALELLHKELRAKQERACIGLGSMNDCYMPIEASKLLTRKALEIIAHHKFPVHIITKGSLVSRDIDLLQEIGKVYAAVSLTITSSCDKMALMVEPHAPTTNERFKTLLQLRNSGIYAGITLMPILPFINDTEENITELVKLAAKHKAAYIVASMGMTIRGGQREYFYNQLDKSFPGIKEKYISHFGDQYNCSSPIADKLWNVFKTECKKYSIPIKMEFYNTTTNEQLTLF